MRKVKLLSLLNICICLILLSACRSDLAEKDSKRQASFYEMNRCEDLDSFGMINNYVSDIIFQSEMIIEESIQVAYPQIEKFEDETYDIESINKLIREYVDNRYIINARNFRDYPHNLSNFDFRIDYEIKYYDGRILSIYFYQNKITSGRSMASDGLNIDIDLQKILSIDEFINDNYKEKIIMELAESEMMSSHQLDLYKGDSSKSNIYESAQALAENNIELMIGYLENDKNFNLQGYSFYLTENYLWIGIPTISSFGDVYLGVEMSCLDYL